MKKSKIKILIILLILYVEVCLYFVAGTYSKYVSTSEADTATRIAKWAVKLGNVDLAGGEKDFSSELILETTNMAKVKSGTIAPNTAVKGNFIIDPNGTEVAIKYKLLLGDIYYKNPKTGEIVTNDIPNIKVTTVKSNVGELVENTNGTFEGKIDLDGNAVTITIEAEWESTDNEIDTKIGYTPLNVVLPVVVTVEQDT